MADKRNPTIGASQVSAVLGLSPWRTPLDVRNALVNREPYEEATSGPLLRGTLIEPGLRRWYANAVGLEVTPGPDLTEPGWAVGRYGHARPDAWHPGDDGIVTVEIKSADWRTKGDWSDGVPAYYLAQVLWQMAARAPGELRITGARVVGYIVDGDAPTVYDIPRDARREAALLARVEGWYERHILGGEPVHDDTTESRAAWYAIAPVERAVMLEPTDADRELTAAWRAARAAEKAAAQRRRELEAQLGARIGSAGGLAGELAWDPVKGRTTINGKALAKAHPDIFAGFSKTGNPSRRFRDLTQTDEPESSEET